MVRRAPRGASLVELMVVCFLFLLIMSLILGFYVYANNVTRYRDAKSATYRRVAITLDHIETEIQNARIYAVREDQILYTLPHVKNRVTDWEPAAYLLLATTPEPGQKSEIYVRHNKAVSQHLAWLEPGEKVVFQIGPQYVDVWYNGKPKADGEPEFQILRRVLVENY